MRALLHGAYKSAAERVLPTRTQSAFKEKGVLTPDEFVAAGDYLVHTCPTWAWEAGDPKKARPYLPPGKQFLITRNVPCLRRAATVEEYGEREEQEVEGGGVLGEGEEGWVTASNSKPAPATTTNADGFEEIPSIGGGGGGDTAAAAGGGGSGGAQDAAGAVSDLTAGEGGEGGGGGADDDDDDDVPDIADLELEDDEEDEAVVRPSEAAGGGGGSEEHILKTRTYDLLITYDKYYQVPRFWLIGYDEDRQPLTQSQVMEDVSQEHARKTVTWDPHPHGSSSVQAASIHPCQHANVMHKLSAKMAGEQGEFNVEHYLVLFLKFIASVVPTIEYDYTMAAGGQ